jgi:hypothetical protein
VETGGNSATPLQLFTTAFLDGCLHKSRKSICFHNTTLFHNPPLFGLGKSKEKHNRCWQKPLADHTLFLQDDAMASTVPNNNLPQSDLFAVRDTAHSGRGVFASKPLKSNTPILSSDVISASVILREYKGEVCAQCFLYERGRKLKHRIHETGTSFCSSACQREWTEETNDDGIAAWQSLETFVKAKLRSNSNAVGNVYDCLPDADTEIPTEEEIRATWAGVESTAHFIGQARVSGSKAKPHRRAVQAVLNVPPNVDILGFQLSGTLARAKVSDTAWDGLMGLVPDNEPYASSDELRNHVHAYLHLLALLPVSLLPHVTAEKCLELARRDSWNSFGIRSLDDGGDEFFGFGVWPAASFFNHSCAPNLRKTRLGRTWQFWTDGEVEMDGELSISYLGGEEKDLGLLERRRRLMATWGFTCACEKCRNEEEMGESVEDCDEDIMDGVELSSEGTADGIEIGADGV